MYEANHAKSVPSFVIVKPQLRSKSKLEQVKDPVGPWKYKPTYPGETYKGQKFPGQNDTDAFELK